MSADRSGDGFDDALLDALVQDYVSSREDKRAADSMRLTIIGFAITLMSFFGYVVSRDGSFIATPGTGVQAGGLPDLLVVLLPMIPLALGAMVGIVGTEAALRSLYSRMLERQIRKELVRRGRPETLGFIFEEIDVGAARTSSARAFLFPLTLILALTAIALLVGFTGWCIYAVPLHLKIVMIVVYAPLGASIMHRGYIAATGARKMFLDLQGPALNEVSLELKYRKSLDSALVWFHLLPRRGFDYVFKSAFYVLGPILAFSGNAAWAFSLLPAQIVGIVVVLVVFELVVYQGRYIVNDMRGHSSDLAHPDAHKRKRLAYYYPDPARALIATGVNTSARGLVMVVTILSMVSVSRILIASVTALVITSLVYDSLRECRPEGRARTAATVTSIVILVGVGYAIRSGLAIALVQSRLSLTAPTGAKLMGLLFPWALGTLFVTMSWTFDAISHTDYSGSARVGRIPAGTRIAQVIWRKPQLLALLALKGEDAPRYQDAGQIHISGSFNRYLSDGDPRNPYRFVPSLAASAMAIWWVTYCLDIGPQGSLVWWISAGVLTIVLGRAGKLVRWLAAGLLVVDLLLIVLFVTGLEKPLELASAFLPLLILVGVQCVFRAASAQSLLHPSLPTWLKRWIGYMEWFIVRLVLGSEAELVLKERKRG